MANDKEIPSRLVYMQGVLDALRALGGKGTSKQVYERLIDQGVARKSDLEVIQESGETRFIKETRFARKELADAGLVLKGLSGTWILSDKGLATFLDPEQARAIVRSRRHRVGVAPPTPFLGPTRGPVPAVWSGNVSRSAPSRAWTYAMRFGDTDIWKVGYSADLEQRLASVNQHVPTELIGQKWELVLKKVWADVEAAYEMEQLLLFNMSSFRTVGERLRCDANLVRQNWRRAVSAVRNGRHLSPQP